MRQYIPFVLAALCLWFAFGCAPARVYRYPGFTIRADSPAVVNRECTAKKWDDGRPRRPGASTAGCWRPAAREILVRWDCEGAQAIPHELAHMFHVWRDTYTYEWVP